MLYEHDQGPAVNVISFSFAKVPIHPLNVKLDELGISGRFL